MPLAPSVLNRVKNAMKPVHADLPNKDQFDLIIKQIETTNPAVAHYMKGFETRMSNAIKELIAGMEEKKMCLYILLSAYEERDRECREVQAQLEKLKDEIEWGPDPIISSEEQIKILMNFMLNEVERTIELKDDKSDAPTRKRAHSDIQLDEFHCSFVL